MFVQKISALYSVLYIVLKTWVGFIVQCCAFLSDSISCTDTVCIVFYRLIPRVNHKSLNVANVPFFFFFKEKVSVLFGYDSLK